MQAYKKAVTFVWYSATAAFETCGGGSQQLSCNDGNSFWISIPKPSIINKYLEVLIEWYVQQSSCYMGSEINSEGKTEKQIERSKTMQHISLKITVIYMSVNTDRLWISNWIYWTLANPWPLVIITISLIHTLYSSLEHIFNPSTRDN
jgi:hypothetical protein